MQGLFPMQILCPFQIRFHVNVKFMPETWDFLEMHVEKELCRTQMGNWDIQ